MGKKILIVGPAWVGDMMMAQVLFRLLRQGNVNCEIHVLAPAWSEALLSHMPEIKKSIVLPWHHGQLQLRQRYQFAKSLRAEKYDQAIVLPNSFKSALIPYWANIPLRTGWLGEYRFGLLNDIRYLDKKYFSTMVSRFAALAFLRDTALPANLPTPSLQVTTENTDVTLQKYNLSVRQDQPLLILCPGAEFGPAKCWPAKHFATVANQKLSEGWMVWIMGSSRDAAIAADIHAQTQHRTVNLAGKTTLSDAVDLLSLASVVIANDSGLMHIAAAVGCRVIALYGSTSPQFAPPLTNQATILTLQLPCQPCRQRVCPFKHHHCMELLLPEKVAACF